VKQGDGTAPARGVASEYHERRLERLIDRLPERLQKIIRWLRRPGLRWVRLVAGVLFIAGCFLSVLPIFGIWLDSPLEGDGVLDDTATPPALPTSEELSDNRRHQRDHPRHARHRHAVLSSFTARPAPTDLGDQPFASLRAHPIRRFRVNRAATVFTRLPTVPKIMPDVPPSTPVPLFDGQASGLVERMVERPEHND
jgi:hypothetical protein